MMKPKKTTGSSVTNSGLTSSRVATPALRRPARAASSAGSARFETVSDSRCDSGGSVTRRCSADSGGAISGLMYATTIT